MTPSPTSSENTRAPRRGRVFKPRCSRACELCRRRKERCDGRSPCSRCLHRNVGPECRRKRITALGERLGPFISPLPSPPQASDSMAPPKPPAALGDSMLLQDQKGLYTFVGDSSNLSFLQTIRSLVGRLHGPCRFADDNSQQIMLEASPDKHSYWLDAREPLDPPQLTVEHATELIQSYILATNCILDVFDEAELLDSLHAWVQTPEARSSIPSPMYYLVLAIGAQTSVHSDDKLAHRLFECGRHTAQRFMEDASVWTVRAYSLISMYMLNACRRNAAFMYLGTAVIAAYALGLHRKEVSYQFSKEEQQERERLWKVIRILDLFMGASLGRPPVTSESRVTNDADDDYSASTDLCFIFERILADVYAERAVSTTSISTIAALHRKWASHFRRGMITDRIEAGDFIPGSGMPNISALHLIEAYYWTIMLLTRPFLTEAVIAHVETPRSDRTTDACAGMKANSGPVLACVHSAIKTIDLLKVLLGVQGLPRRLPYVTNSLFVAGLVLGFAYFGDLDQTFPLGTHLNLAHQLLLQFSDDILAQRNAQTIGHLRQACDAHIAARFSERMRLNDLVVAGIFGQVHLKRAKQNDPVQSGGKRSSLRPDQGQPEMGNCLAADEPGCPPMTDDCAPHDGADSTLGDPAPSLDDIMSEFQASSLSMSPRTLCFDSLFDISPFFSTALCET